MGVAGATVTHSYGEVFHNNPVYDWTCCIRSVGWYCGNELNDE